jgi:hypothetical protein
MTTRLTYQDVLLHKNAAPPFSSPSDHALFKARFDKMMEEYPTSLPELGSADYGIRAWALQRFKLYEDAEAKALASNLPYVPHYQQYAHVIEAMWLSSQAAFAEAAAKRPLLPSAMKKRAIASYELYKKKYNAMMVANAQKYKEMAKEEFIFKDMPFEHYTVILTDNNNARQRMMAEESKALMMMERAKVNADETI